VWEWPNKNKMSKCRDLILIRLLLDNCNIEKHFYCSIDMQLRAFWRTFYNLNNLGRFRKGRVLLTGATGFLGVFLLRELLLQTKVCTFVLQN
jgi:hypothetical protein